MAHAEFLLKVTKTADLVDNAARNGMLPSWAASVRDLVKQVRMLTVECTRLGRYEEALGALARKRLPTMTAEQLAGEILAGDQAQVSQARPSQTGEGD